MGAASDLLIVKSDIAKLLKNKSRSKEESAKLADLLERQISLEVCLRADRITARLSGVDHDSPDPAQPSDSSFAYF